MLAMHLVDDQLTTIKHSHLLQHHHQLTLPPTTYHHQTIIMKASFFAIPALIAGAFAGPVARDTSADVNALVGNLKQSVLAHDASISMPLPTFTVRSANHP